MIDDKYKIDLSGLIVKSDNQVRNSLKITEQPEYTKEDKLFTQFYYIKNMIMYNGYTEMNKFVSDNIHTLLSSAIDKKPKSLRIVTDKDFLISMHILNIELDSEYTNRFNRVFRAYSINPSKNAIYNQESCDLMYKLAYKFNKELVDSLIQLGLSESCAVWIAVNRYSSTDERRNIRRMIRAIQHINPIIMTETMIINILSKTFNNQLTNLFISIMTDKFDNFDNEDEKYVYSTVSNSILNILETMNEEEIQDILLDYYDELNKSGVSGRFSLKSINSKDYKSISSALESLESKGIEIE